MNTEKHTHMLIDSHCHLDRLDLSPFDNDFGRFLQQTAASGVHHLLCVAIDLESYPKMRSLVDNHENISVSVGVHPNETDCREPTVEELVDLARDPKVVAIGETGLDYYRSTGNLKWQRERFRTHIRAAKTIRKPLIIHTRESQQETLEILAEENADTVGGVFHCFTGDWATAKQAVDLGFHISFSGILTFRNAQTIQEAARKVPADRILIETDSPYLAPVPHRGKANYPYYVRHVAEALAQLRGISLETLSDLTTRNFYALFSSAQI